MPAEVGLRLHSNPPVAKAKSPLGPPFQPLSATGDRSPSGDLAFATG